jgi:hypothetical protein
MDGSLSDVVRLESWIGSLIRWRSVRSCKICFTCGCGVCSVISGSLALSRMLIAAFASESRTTLHRVQ